MEQQLEADYVIVGSGAVGMAFADVILTESDATIIMVVVIAVVTYTLVTFRKSKTDCYSGWRWLRG